MRLPLVPPRRRARRDDRGAAAAARGPPGRPDGPRPHRPARPAAPTVRWAGAERAAGAAPAHRACGPWTPGSSATSTACPSDHPASSDLAFHALREYVARRRPAARALALVGQGRHPAGPAVRRDPPQRGHRPARRRPRRRTPTARSSRWRCPSAASLAVRAMRDDFEVTLVCGDVHAVVAVGRRPARRDLPDHAGRGRPARAPPGGPRRPAAASSLVVLVTGSGCDPALLRTAGAEFPADALRVAGARRPRRAQHDHDGQRLPAGRARPARRPGRAARQLRRRGMTPRRPGADRPAAAGRRGVRRWP